MYEQLFHFNQRPFPVVPNPAAYFPASAIDAALETAELCVERASGPVAVFGASGSGKSLLLAMLQRHLARTRRLVPLTACTRLSSRQDLLQNVLFELGLSYRGLSEAELRLSLIEHLRPTAKNPQPVLLLVDDAQQLPLRLLDELRILANWVHQGQPRIQLVLAGTPPLEDRLNHPQLELLNQRLAARCYLAGFRRDEVEAYIGHQVLRAGRPEQDVFDRTAIAAVQQLCDGCPRLVNQVCDYALILAASAGQATVNGEMIAEAFADLQRLPASLAAVERESASSNAEACGGSVIEFGSLDAPSAPPAKSGPTIAATASELPPPSASPEPIDSDWPVASPEVPTADDDAVRASARHAEILQALIGLINEPPPVAPLNAAKHPAEAASKNLAETVAETAPRGAAPRGDESRSIAARDPFAESFDTEEIIVDDFVLQVSKRPESACPRAPDPPFAHRSFAIPEIATRSTSVSPAGSIANEEDLLALQCPLVDYPAYQASDPDAFAASPNRTAPADDRDLLFVTRSPSCAEEASDERAIVRTDVSRGKAIRMDYERLFDRLRNRTPAR